MATLVAQCIGGGLVLGAALANAVGPAGFAHNIGPLVPFACWVGYLSIPANTAIASVPITMVAGGAFVGYNFMHGSRFCRHTK